MTRKRFVKILMANGIQRNEAEALAKKLRAGSSYNSSVKIAIVAGKTEAITKKVAVLRKIAKSGLTHYFLAYGKGASRFGPCNTFLYCDESGSVPHPGYPYDERLRRCINDYCYR